MVPDYASIFQSWLHKHCVYHQLYFYSCVSELSSKKTSIFWADPHILSPCWFHFTFVEIVRPRYFSWRCVSCKEAQRMCVLCGKAGFSLWIAVGWGSWQCGGGRLHDIHRPVLPARENCCGEQLRALWVDGRLMAQIFAQTVWALCSPKTYSLHCSVTTCVMIGRWIYDFQNWYRPWNAQQHHFYSTITPLLFISK